MSYVIALDQGTTSSRALLVDRDSRVCGVAQRPFTQHFPKPGWVEHDPFDILETQIDVLNELMLQQGISAGDVECIGITNQRETTLIWDRHTGMPVSNAIVWQCRRTADIVDSICSDPEIASYISAVTGLVPDAYFSASKVKWILDNVPGARESAEKGDLLFGTVDTWLVWNLTGGAVHATDYTNASRTMLFDIHKGCWDERLCELFDVPMGILPEVRPSSADYGSTVQAAPSKDTLLVVRGRNLPPIPQGIRICGVAGDQQSSLFGQGCTDAGMAKNTYGTGCFLLMHTGETAVASKNNLITTIAASAPGTEGMEYALEGSVFMAGALIQWIRDEMGLIETAEQSEELALSVPDSAGVFIVPAFTGLGAPYWDSEARGAIYGLTRGARREHVVRAALESLAYQVSDLVRGMEDDADCCLELLAVDGGASRNNFLMQFQSDILRTRLQRPVSTETTALGAAYLAGLYAGFWRDLEEIREKRVVEREFTPAMDESIRLEVLDKWSRCIERTRSNF